MDPFPGAYPQSEPATPDVNTQQNQYQYHQDTQDARMTSKTSGAGLGGPAGVGAQQPEHRYNEPKSQAISAVESGEVQSHRDDSFHSHPTRLSGYGNQIGETREPSVHRYTVPRSEAVPAVLGAQVQAHRDDAATHTTSGQPSEQYGLGTQSHQSEQPSVHRYDAPRSETVPAVLAAQVQAHRDDASHASSKQPSGQPGHRDNNTSTTAQPDVHRYDQPRSQAIPAVLAAEVQSHRDDGAHSSSRQPVEQQGHEKRSDYTQQHLQQTQSHPQQQQQDQGWPLRRERLGQQPEQQHESQARESHQGHSSDNADEDKNTPYWGSLPTAAQGGIYNSVTGHGSTRDDHDQHHGLPDRSRNQEQGAPGLTAHRSTSQHENSRGIGAGVAGTGIYNTVIGHGSQDDHAKHHQSSVLAGTNPNTTSASAHYQSDEHARQQALQGAPRDTSNSAGLAAAQRSGMQDTSSSTYSPSSTYSSQNQDADTHYGRNAAVGAGVGAAALAGSHALHEHRASGADDTTRHAGPYNTDQTSSQTYDQTSSGFGSAHHGASNTSVGGQAVPAARSTQSEHATQRAFPLASSTGYEHKHTDETQHATQAPVTHRIQEKTTTTTREPRHQHERQDAHHQTNKSPSPDARASRSRSGSKSEKSHHGLLSVFSSKHRDDSSSHPKVAEDERGHRKLVKDPPADIAPAVIAARQASVSRKRNSLDRGLENRQDVGATSTFPPHSESQAYSSPPSQSQPVGHNDRHETMIETLKKETESRHGMAAGGLFHNRHADDDKPHQDTHRDRHEADTLKKETESRHGMASGGLFHSKPTDARDRHHDTPHDRATTESRSYGDSDASRGTHPPSVVGGTENREANRLQDDSHHGRAVGIGAGVAAGGLAASELAQRHRDGSSSEAQPRGAAIGTAGNTGTTGTSGTSNDHHPNAGTTSTGHSSSPLTDRSLPPHFSNTHNTVTGDALPYNTLASGTPSGVAIGSRSHGDQEQGTHSRGAGGLDSSRTTHGSHETRAQTGSDDHFDSKVGRNLAAGAGTGAAAVAGSSALQNHQSRTGDGPGRVPSDATHGARENRDNLTSATTTGNTDGYVQDDRADQSHIGRDVGVGAAAGAAAYAGSRAIHDHQRPSSETNTTGQTSGDRLFTQPAHRFAQSGPRETATSTNTTQSVYHSDPTTSTSGKGHGYNQLASGTPSGVATSSSHGLTGGDSSYASPQASHYGSAEGYPESHDNRVTGLAAGAGTGAAAYAGSRALQGEHVSYSTATTGAGHYDIPSLAGQDASRYINTTNTQDTSTARTTSGPHQHLTSGTSSNVMHERSTAQDPSHDNKISPSSRDAYAGERAREAAGQSDGYGHLASGTASGLAAGGVAGGVAGAAASHHTGTGSHATLDSSRAATQGAHTSSRTSGSSELPPQYNILPSGTPSGVNIEYKRMSKELSRDS